MQLDLGIEIKENNIYTGAGNIFSKLILMQKILKTKDKYLIIVENENRANAYEKISRELNIEVKKINNFSDINELFHNKTGKFVATKDIFNVNIKDLNKKFFTITRGDKISIQDLAKKLNELNIEFSEFQAANSFYVLGDILNYTNVYGQLVKISFWDDEVDDIFYGNEKIDNYTFSINQPVLNFQSEELNSELLALYSEKDIFTILDSIDFYAEYDNILKDLTSYLVFSLSYTLGKEINLGFSELIINDLDDFKKILASNKSKKYIVTRNKTLLSNFLNLNNIENVVVIENSLNKLKSFSFDNGFVVCDDNISRIFVKKRIKRSLSENLDLLLQIKKGDYVVHIDHGIGIFNEIIEKEIGGIKKEYLEILYAGQDKLFIPITEVGRITKYVGNENPKLTTLSTKDWEKKLKKATEDAEKIAKELLDIYANRNIQKGYEFASKKDEENKFFSSFEHVYTDDQYSVIEEIYNDMESSKPMDRLLSGDVGFGKTEVAFAAIYKALINGKQAVLISPLVVLAYEHFEKAKERFYNFPFNIGVLTRFEKPSQIKETLNKLKTGKIDLIIGTHRLLSEDVEFKDLGLMVIDEEHKFGVKDKEKIKKLKGSIDILSMSATPIPRSLNMALNGLKDVSMLTTPPVGKQSIETIVSPFDDEIIFKAAKKEFERGGQIFFIHNKVETILAMQGYLESLLPGKKVLVAHGQLAGDTLEKRIIAFKRHEYDILLATTVIENGIDFANVNTIFINDSNNFGISQIHQLRGRVGRAYEKAYAYLLFRKDKIKEDAAKRLKTIVDYSHLGAGFELAIKDLEIRGGGEILGIKQSGSTEEVGISLFLEMLEDKIEELKQGLSEQEYNSSEKMNLKNNVSIDLNLEAHLPDEFFTGELDKLNFYREIESIRTIKDLENIINGFKELNKEIKRPSNNLFDLIKIKIYSNNYKIKSIKRVGINYQIDFEENSKLEDIKRFLILDKEIKFFVVTQFRLRANVKNFESEEKFVQYLLLIFEDKIKTKKVKIKKKM